MKYGLRNFGEGNSRQVDLEGKEVKAKKDSRSILVTADNLGILSLGYLGRHSLESKEFIQRDDWNEQYMCLDTYEELVERGWMEDTSWVKGKVVVLYTNFGEDGLYDVYLVDIKFE